MELFDLSSIARVRIRLLLYGILYNPDPPKDAIAIERNIQEMHNGDLSKFGTAAEYAASIREALGSETQLSLLLPQPHSEDVIRSFLSKVLDRLSIEKVKIS